MAVIQDINGDRIAVETSSDMVARAYIKIEIA